MARATAFFNPLLFLLAIVLTIFFCATGAKAQNSPEQTHGVRMPLH
jgi:hypothetical protein